MQNPALEEKLVVNICLTLLAVRSKPASLTYCNCVHTVNLTMENHRQWRITRKDIAEFLESLTKYYLLYNSVIYFYLCLEVW